MQQAELLNAFLSDLYIFKILIWKILIWLDWGPNRLPAFARGGRNGQM
jgi:hypothetical protein